MTSRDEQFIAEWVDEQIDVLAQAPVGIRPFSPNARLISNLCEAYREDNEIIEQVRARLSRQIALHARTLAGPETPARAPQPAQAPRPERPRAERPRKKRRARFLETLAALLVIGVLVGGMALILRVKQSSLLPAATPTKIARTTVLTPTPTVTPAAPAADAPGLYITTENNVERVDLSTGKTLWHVANSYSAQPVIMGNIVILSDNQTPQQGTLKAVNVATGRVIWHDAYQASFLQGANGIVYVSGCSTPSFPPPRSPCTIMALNASNGAKLWSYDSSGTAWMTLQNGVIYGASIITFFALNATTGAPIWQKALQQAGWQISGAPVVASNLFSFASCPTNPTTASFSCDLYAFDAGSGKALWDTPVNSYLLASPAIANGVVYAAGREGKISALNASSGALLWTYNTGGTLTKPLLIAGGVIYAETEADTGSATSAHLFALNAASRSVLWSKYLTAYFGTGPDWQTLVLANGLLYAVNGRHSVSVFQANDGTLLKSYSIADASAIVEFKLVT